MLVTCHCLSLKPSCAFPVCHDTEERCRLVLSYVLEVSLGLLLIDQQYVLICK